MGLQYRKRQSLGGGARLNYSASRRGPGISVSQRVGPLTLNSRGRGSLRIAPGLSFRFGKRNSGSSALIMLAIVLLIEAIQIALVVLFYAAVFAIWLGRWIWFGTQALIERRRERQGQANNPENPSLGL
jgi:hypothetical protein